MENNMERKNLVALALVGLLMIPAMSGCITTDNGAGVQAIEDMSELEFNKWNLYVTLGVKIAANRSLQEGLVTQEELNLAALGLELIGNQPVLDGTTSLIQSSLEDVGLNNDEIMLILLIAEQEILQRGGGDYIDPVTGQLAVSPRTEILLDNIAQALRDAAFISDEEFVGFVDRKNMSHSTIKDINWKR